eukprot:CAMPEP_0172540506 /NCGR_PEP_ID=MMETSP1067-20121228/11495_1 /TAXON_ID=265564 ORGANISM="Thalassiosira punctigera, Strain Tpunct2005C2" /NCGR_SAMPLE_ID=MMETSP1067 /ASSEMBLY_ACC=CAM_ASM_000444 /LENGTH=859 /DNA_ID=CAMNT_0013326375 /DNA_START=143 /DNA_END=2722 /DNA_ORIENTATION=+
MAKGNGSKNIRILLASSGAIANSFNYYESQRYRCATYRPTMSSHSRAAVESVAPPAVMDSGKNSLELGDRKVSSIEFVEGYEYVHPDITAMILTKACQKESRGPSLFVVDTSTLKLQREPKRQGDVQYSPADIMPMDLLAGLADECDHAVFDGTADEHIPQKIFGLVCLAKLPTISRPKEHTDGTFKEMHKSSMLVASMVALNLLESSIRCLVLESRPGNNKDGGFAIKSSKIARRCTNNNDCRNARGAPLLSLLIEEMSNLDHVTFDPTSSTFPNRAVLSASELAPILRALLLPTKSGGINIRNLVSHGFLSTIERRWFSLTLILIQTLDCLLLSNEKAVRGDSDGGSGEVDSAMSSKTVDQDPIPSSLAKYHSMAREVQYGKNILRSLSSMQELEERSRKIVPSSHMPLLRFGFHLLAPTIQPTLRSTKQSGESTEDPTSFNQKYKDSTTAPSIPPLTAIFTTLMCYILEHSLRILWCGANRRPDDCFARPSEYYVTLDGHGQRLKHDVMIFPYLGNEKTRNEMIHAIGAESCAMLSDLFAAPSAEAPNIRSAVCHGTWDVELVREVKGLAQPFEKSLDRPVKSDPLLVDSICAMISCLDLVTLSLSGQTRISSYRPVFTYTAMATRALDRIVYDLDELDALISNNNSIGDCIRAMELQQPKLCVDLSPLKVDLKVLREMAFDLFPTMKKKNDEIWGVEDTFCEHQTNLNLSGNIVVLTLLSDASHAIETYLNGVKERVDIMLSMQPSSTKDRRTLKTTARFCSVAMIARDFYTFTVYVALVSMKPCQDLLNEDAPNKKSRSDFVKASERSRMALSTFDSNLTTNLDRSLKALQQYLQGKAVKKVVLEKKELEKFRS